MFFDFLEPFLRVWLQSFQKVLIWPKKKILIKKKFHADLNPLKKLLKMHQKQVFTNMSKSEKVHIFLTFLLITFFVCIFSKLFQQGIQNHIPIYPYWISEQNFFFLLLALFINFDCKCAGNSSKKRKVFFYECVLEFT